MSALAMTPTSGAAAPGTPVARVAVMRNGDRWTAEYRFGRQAPVWIFSKSNLPRNADRSWRADSVRVLTPGVTLRRIGNFDALVPQGAMPKRVRLSFTPFSGDINAGNQPAVPLGEGAIALSSDAFTIVPMASVGAVEQAPKDDSQLPGATRPTQASFSDRAGPVLVKGAWQARAVVDTAETYVVFGRVRPLATPAMTTIIDPGLPQWLADSLTAQLPQMLSRYREQLGPPASGRPMLLASWAGAARGGASRHGWVVPGMVIVKFSGKALLQPTAKFGEDTRWFIAHEAAHFWLGQTVAPAARSDSWIAEGGADLLALRATAAVDPAYDVKAQFSNARANCLNFLANGSLATAYEREKDFRAYYDCGIIINAAAERASAGDFADFVRTLIQRNRATGVVTREHWLALLDERTPGRQLSAKVATLLDQPLADPTRALDDFIAAARIDDEFPAAASGV